MKGETTCEKIGWIVVYALLTILMFQIGYNLGTHPQRFMTNTMPIVSCEHTTEAQGESNSNTPTQ